MTLTPEQLDELEAKAKEATPGPWTVSEPASAGLHPRQPSGSAQVRCDEATNRVPSGCLIPYFILHHTDAAHIAANSPDVTLHLVAVYRAALAWSDADRRLANAGYSIGDYDDAKDKVDTMLDGIRAALRGTP